MLSTATPFITSIVAISVNALIAVIYILSLSQRWTKRNKTPPRRTQEYEDEDGQATPDSLQRFSVKWQRAILIPAVTTAALIAAASAVSTSLTSDSHDDQKLVVRQWISLLTWLLVLVQTVHVCRASDPVERHNLAAWNSLASFVLAAALLVQNVSLWMSSNDSRLLRPNTVFDIVQFLLAAITSITSALIPRRPDLFRNGRIVDREKSVSLLSRFTFSWPANILDYANKHRGLTSNELPQISHSIRAETLYTRFQQTPRQGKLWRSLLDAHRKTFIAQWALQIITAVTNFVPQIVLYLVLRLLESRDAGEEVQVRLWMAAIAIGVAVAFGAWAESMLFYTCFLKIQVPMTEQLAAVVFGKAVRKKDVKSVAKAEQAADADSAIMLNAGSGIKGEDSVGQKDDDEDEEVTKSKQNTINLIGIDAKRIADFATYSYLIAGSVIKMVIAVSFLIKLVGVIPAVCGFVPPLLMTPINWFVAKKYGQCQDEIMRYRDQKMAVVTEALQGIRQIKFSALEAEWYEKIMKTRRKELQECWKSFMCDIGLIAIYIFGPTGMSAATLCTYAVLNGSLSASVAFTTLSIMEAIEMTMSVIPEIISNMLDALVSARRIQEYLDSAELEKSVQSGEQITFQQAKISWPSDQEEDQQDRVFSLENLNLSFEMGQLNVIAGKTGSGKTLLLSALIGEADLLSGRITMPDATTPQDRFDHKANKSNWILSSAVAYVAQIPWIENATLRDNILFGLPFDQRRYDQVIFACALTKDLEILQDGDMTDIGANGINLSGGQKWRTSFARALYSRAGILILDDVFSAVDAHVGSHLFENALTGELCKGRTRILVTHHVGLCLPKTRYLVLLENGQAIHAGSVEELRKQGALSDLLVHDATEQPKENNAVTQDAELLIDDGGHDLVRAETRTSRRLSSMHHDGTARHGLQRHASHATRASEMQDGDEDKAHAKKFTEEEARETGAIKLSIYASYLKACRGYVYWIFVFSLFLSWIAVYLGRSYWISYWTRQYRTKQQNNETLFSLQDTSNHHFTLSARLAYDQLIVNADDQQKDTLYYVGVWVAISLVAWIIGFTRYASCYFASIRGSQILFEKLTKTILHASLRFLDTTPVGRISNRFTSDFNMVDSKIAIDGGFLLHCLVSTTSVIVAGLFISPYMILLSLALMITSGYFGRKFLKAAREVKRLESNAKSPIFEQFGSVLTGIATIRAFDKTNTYVQRMYEKIDTQATCLWHMNLFNRWMAFRSNMTGALFTLTTAVLIVSLKSVDAPLAGFALSFSLQLADSVMWLLRQYTNLEINFNAVERIIEYSNLATETEDGQDVPAAWPTNGTIELEKFTVSYAPDLPPVLKNLSFVINANERIGVVGRTGAGKSSLTLALFRFLEARSGSISIDGIDISKIKLHDLRSRLAIIPQDPVLFSGTVRSNLDPFDQHSDVELYDALARVHLVDSSSVRPSGTATPIPGSSNLITAAESRTANSRESLVSPVQSTTPPHPSNSNTAITLSTRISESGLNLSSGQRQLLCLARAIVSQPKILILDEATSSVDMATDALIQRSIREEFGGRCTLIVIAHRLTTIADFDRVLVLGGGEMVEFDSPKNLLRREGEREGGFKEMVEKSGERGELKRMILT